MFFRNLFEFIIPANTKIDFVKKKRIAFIFFGLFVCLSIVFVSIRGINFGIDFKGGTLIEVRMPTSVDIGALRSDLSSFNIGDVKLQRFGSDRDIMVRIEKQKEDEQEYQKTLGIIKKVFGEKAEYRRIETVGPKVSRDLKKNGIWAIFFALTSMLIYIWFRFEWQFGLCAVIALVNDCISVLGFYSVLWLEFNETAIIAILTTAGYSINDTVVIYDRIRENLRKHRKIALKDIINNSINSVLSRTVLTSGTTLLALGALYFFGGSVVASFSLPIIFGVIIGTFSSIFLSSLLLLHFKIHEII